MDRAWVTEIGIIDGVLSHIGSGVPVSEMSGEWSSRLVPSDESEAYQEGYQHAFDEIVHSRARVQELTDDYQCSEAGRLMLFKKNEELGKRVSALEVKVQRLSEAGDKLQKFCTDFQFDVYDPETMNGWTNAKEGV